MIQSVEYTLYLERCPVQADNNGWVWGKLHAEIEETPCNTFCFYPSIYLSTNLIFRLMKWTLNRASIHLVIWPSDPVEISTLTASRLQPMYFQGNLSTGNRVKHPNLDHANTGEGTNRCLSEWYRSHNAHATDSSQPTVGFSLSCQCTTPGNKHT